MIWRTCKCKMTREYIMMFGHRNGNSDRGGQGVPVEATPGLFWAWGANHLEEQITMGPWSRRHGSELASRLAGRLPGGAPDG